VQSCHRRFRLLLSAAASLVIIAPSSSTSGIVTAATGCTTRPVPVVRTAP
jgi:hypothetical protein